MKTGLAGLLFVSSLVQVTVYLTVIQQRAS